MSLLFLVHAICQPASLIVLGISAAIDLKDRVIPNELVVAIAVIGFAQGLALRPGLVWFSLLVAIIVFFGLWIVAHVKIIGGGDLKLISAVTLLVPPDRVGQLLIDIVLAGGLLSCFYLAAHYGLKRLPEPRSAAAEAAPSAKKSGFVRTLKAERIRIGGGYPMPYAVAVLGGVIVYNAMQFLQPQLCRCAIISQSTAGYEEAQDAHSHHARRENAPCAEGAGAGRLKPRAMGRNEFRHRDLAPDQRDISDDAHRMCRFGQWYQKDGISELEYHPGVAEIGLEHERMHQHAARLLRASASGDPIEIGDFERFVTSVKRLRLELATVQRELADTLFNLDPLTGTRSRTSLLTGLREQRELVRRGVQPCALAMMDLDHFKAINDKYGHATGDKVLIYFARHIIMHLRPYDKIFRFGGDEFLIFMPDADLKAGRDVVDRLREELGALRIDANGKEMFQVTVSFGLTLLDPDIPVEQSIDRADNALYVAKAMGRNRVIVWNDSMSASPAGSV